LVIISLAVLRLKEYWNDINVLMKSDKYNYVTDPNHETYEFLSSGPKGTIKKVVLFQEFDNYPGVFNLAFGDWDDSLQKIKDDVRSNNSDRDKVLATVASTVIDFFEKHPEAILLAQGATPSKTRLYQMGINANWDEITQMFIVEGRIKNNWEPFPPGKNYEAFALKGR
jgi:hypothetical protein